MATLEKNGSPARRHNRPGLVANTADGVLTPGIRVILRELPLAGPTVAKLLVVLGKEFDFPIKSCHTMDATHIPIKCLTSN